jgi:uncharacterized membrane protein YgcG
MNRRGFLALAMSGGATVALAGSARAAGLVDDLVRELRSQGFSSVNVSRTMLGRVRIEAIGSAGSREIVLNPNSGEILRDLWTSSGSVKSRPNRSSGKSSGKDSDEPDDKDEADNDADDDADDDSDNSGSGSSNSGSGNSGSGGGGDDSSDDE